MRLVHIMWPGMRMRWRTIAAIFVLQLGQIILSLWLPALNADVIDTGILTRNESYIWRTGALMFVITLIQFVASAAAIYFSSRASMEIGRDLRARAFRHVQRFSAADQHRFGAPTLITRVTNDVQQIQMVILLLFAIIVTAPMMGIGGLAMAIRQDSTLSLLLLIIVPALAVVIFFVMRALLPRFAIVQQRIDRINTLLREQLTGARVIRAFVRQPLEAQRFDEANRHLRSIHLQVGFIWSFFMPMVSVIVGLSAASVVYVGARRIEVGGMQVGSLSAFISYLMMILGSVMMAGMMAMVLPRGDVSAARLKEILDTVPSITAPEEPLSLPSGRLSVDFDDVQLRFEEAENPVFSGISFHIDPGTQFAIIGSTGSGKTSLVRLIPRLVDLTHGSVKVGGIDVRRLDPLKLRERVAYIPQTSFLFSGTIASNVAGTLNERQIDRPRVTKALDAAQAHDFVAGLDQGIDAPVEAGGKNYSGGQRQRIAIARAIYRCLPDATGTSQADVLIFDDSFSALDFQTDAALRMNLPHYIGNIPVIIVAQRVSTIRNADQILVLDAGHSAGLGSHNELMRSSQVYQEIVASQLSAQEAQ
ncbi:MAG: ABC transporter ATP-binding protein [Actinomycetaceae bacterium]|nr:ABC transporter ATP-binding protein [Actinomycetaceae bacterium]MDY6083059.1 ABC transporter ATP-binding protein [Actinomycetaceae bacterium]